MKQHLYEKQFCKNLVGKVRVRGIRTKTTPSLQPASSAQQRIHSGLLLPTTQGSLSSPLPAPRLQGGLPQRGQAFLSALLTLPQLPAAEALRSRQGQSRDGPPSLYLAPTQGTRSTLGESPLGRLGLQSHLSRLIRWWFYNRKGRSRSQTTDSPTSAQLLKRGCLSQKSIQLSPLLAPEPWPGDCP